MSLFNPLIQPRNQLTGIQKYLLRLIFGCAGKTILHRKQLVEVIETHTKLRRLYPLMDSKLAESHREPFWIPIVPSASKKTEVEQRKREVQQNRLRKYPTIGIRWESSRPKYARRVRLYSRFPSPSYLRYLVTELAYDPDAAWAAFARPRGFSVKPDRRRKKAAPSADEQAQAKTNGEFQRLDYGDNLYVPAAPTRRTLTGGGFTEKQVRQGLSKMRPDSGMKAALLEVVYKRLSPQLVAAKFGFARAKLDVYANRLRKHIRSTARPDTGADLHVEENVSLYSQQLTYPSVKTLDLGWKGEHSHESA
jgi:hypothetical protein